MSLEMVLMSLGVSLGKELGDEFGVVFAEVDEFGGAFVFAAFGDAFDEFGDCFAEFGRGVWNRNLEMSLEGILMSLMSLGVIPLCVCDTRGCV